MLDFGCEGKTGVLVGGRNVIKRLNLSHETELNLS